MKTQTFLFLAGALSFAGCGEEGTADGDADSDVDTDVDTDADTDSDAGGGVLRLTFLDLETPDALNNVIVENLINQNICDNGLNWMIDLGAPDGGSCEFSSGAALTVPDGCVGDSDCEGCDAFAFETKYPPASGTANCSETDFLLPANGVIDSVDIPVHGDIFIVLPLREATLDGTYADDPNFDATGNITAKITMDDANGVDIPSPLNETLCALLARDVGETGNPKDDCANMIACMSGGTPPDPEWDCKTSGNPPDTEVAGEPAWTLGATYEAAYTTLSE